MSSLTIQDKRLSSGVTLLPDDFVDYYMPRANGDFVKIYLYLLRSIHANDIHPTLSSLADIFSCTEKDIIRALHYWEKAGLLSLAYADKELDGIDLLPLPLNVTRQHADADNPIRKTASDQPAQISSVRLRALKSDEEAKQILFITEQYLGQPLSATDMRRILYFYDELHFPEDLIDYLVEYCVNKGARSLNYIEKVGLAWHHDGLCTLKDARAFTNAYKKNYFAIFKSFGIRNRNPIPEEQTDMDRWLTDYGFSLEIIQEAAARTIAKTGQPSFRYAEKILADWHEQGVHTLNDILPLDEKHKAEQHSGTTGSYSGKTGKKSDPSNRFNNFHQRDYDFDELEKDLLKKQRTQK